MVIYNLKLNVSKLIKIFLIVSLFIVISIFILGIYRVFIYSKKESLINNSDISYIQEKNYTNILKSVHENLNSYIGKKICFSGYIYRVYDFNQNEFVLARDMIINSDNQTVVVGFMCQCNESKNFKDKAWVNITGEITKGNYHGEIPIIKVFKITECQIPENSFVYPPDGEYLQTPEI